jgi:hypothetical protein
MIIQLESTSPENTGTARHSLTALARSWGQDTTQAPAQAPTTAQRDGKIIDPVSLATLIISIPSAALAALDLADRITKRRRAAELIDHARQHVTLSLTIPARTIELSTLDPDQLLDLIALEDPPG